MLTFIVKGFVSVVPIKFVAESVPEFPDKPQPLFAIIVCQFGTAAVPIFTINWFFVLSNTSNPLAGFTMAIIAAAFIRGIKTPFVILLISSIALLSGALASLFMATFCACAFMHKNKASRRNNFFIIGFVVKFL